METTRFDASELLDTPAERVVTHRHRPTEKRNDTTQNDGHVAFLFAAHRAVVDVDVNTGLVKVVQIAGFGPKSLLLLPDLARRGSPHSRQKRGARRCDRS